MAVSVNARDVVALAKEARSAMRAAQDELVPRKSGAILVSGVLAEQLARELGAGAATDAVRVDGSVSSSTSDVLVRVIAGEPTDEDEGLVRAADRRGTPVVLVQLWVQADWTPPFVLSPFVVECRPGEGFPVREIADRILDAYGGDAGGLAARVPSLRPSFERSVVTRAVVRAAAVAGRSGARPVLSQEQLRMLGRLSAAGGEEWPPGVAVETPVIGGAVALALGYGFVLRQAAREARRVVPSPVANAAIAAAGTWALARVLRAVGPTRSR